MKQTNHNPIPSVAFQEAMQLYKANHLPVPPVPAELTKDILRINEWVYGTRTDAPSPYFIEAYIEELQTERKNDYVVFGHAGRGIMSYALHFYLVRGSLAVFLQHSWGNADSNPVQDVQYIERDYRLVEQIIHAVEQVQTLQLPQQLVIHHSDLRLDSRWALFTLGSGEFMWHTTKFGQVLETVLDTLNRSEVG